MKYVLTLLLLPGLLAAHADVFIEAESFDDPGGWRIDTQFIEIMGSPYLIAHGLGKPVEDATTTLSLPEDGTYRLWVRTKDWVGPWEAPGAPGRFQVQIGDQPPRTFGDQGADWHWQDGGTIELKAGDQALTLRDLTGFNGRCDAILLTRDLKKTPPNVSAVFPAWRQQKLGSPDQPEEAGTYDLVVVGGGYAGTCAALSAARMGLNVALIQNRGVLGGNGSSEVRVWAKGNTPSGLYPVGDIVEEITDRAKSSPGNYEEFGDDKKESIVLAEPNIDLFLWHHAYGVIMDGDQIAAVDVLDVKNATAKRFRGRLFADCTGHGYIALKAGADSTPIHDGTRMGMSNMWRWQNADAPTSFPETPWALDLNEPDFPYPKRFHAEWFWESGYKKHPYEDLELIRDWNLRANFGAWNAIKNRGAYAKRDPLKEDHAHAELTWMAYIGGTRETKQFLGDVVLTKEDIVSKKAFPDGCVLTTWSIDLHYPREQYLTKYTDNPFIARAQHGKGVDRRKGYPVPYRCFYSRNIDNLFLAGRNISVERGGLGTIRVMKTGGMMGVVVGRAAAICLEKDTTPRGVYEEHLDLFKEYCNLRGYVRRESIDAPFDLSAPATVSEGAPALQLDELPGYTRDDHWAHKEGAWKTSDGVAGFYGTEYQYSQSPGASIRYPIFAKEPGLYEVRLSWTAHPNRATNAPVKVRHALGETTLTINQQLPPKGEKYFQAIGQFVFEKDKPRELILHTDGVDGNVVADAIQVVPVTQK